MIFALLYWELWLKVDLRSMLHWIYITSLFDSGLLFPHGMPFLHLQFSLIISFLLCSYVFIDYWIVLYNTFPNLKLTMSIVIINHFSTAFLEWILLCIIFTCNKNVLKEKKTMGRPWPTQLILAHTQIRDLGRNSEMETRKFPSSAEKGS